MGIVSISLPSSLLTDIDAAVQRDDMRGRSEFFRTAAKQLLQTRPATGRSHVHGSITVTYPHGKEARLSEVRHAFHDVVLSLMHTHCEPEVCMDVLLVGGPPERIHTLQTTLERMRDVTRSRLVTMT